MKKCKSCALSIDDESEFCTHCGSDQQDTRKYCNNCKAVINEEKFCSECGHATNTSQNTTKICRDCGTPATEDMAYCAKCGKDISDEAIRLNNQIQNAKLKNKKRIRNIVSLIFVIAIGVSISIFLASDQSDLAIDIAKSSELYYDDESTQESINDFMKDNYPETIYGWDAEKVEKDVYFVEFGFDVDDDDPYNGYKLYAFQVSVNSEIAVLIIGNERLEKKYKALGMLE